jgi:hypothetical protein
MVTRLNRRTLLLCGGLVVLTAGGAVAVSQARRSPAPPRLPRAPRTEDLPVVAVPEPTARPVEVVYCAGWDATRRAPVSPMAESVARAQDAKGAQWAAVLFVDGVARTVVEVCWQAHHAELWNVDDSGRRYRGVAYRRWPDDRVRLFEVRGWNGNGPDSPEFDDDEPTLRARVDRDENGAGTAVTVYAEMPDGSLQLQEEAGYWPEPSRPPDDLALPSVGGWPRLARMTGRVTVRPGPATVPSRFPWRPPHPLRPRYVTELVTAGARFRKPDGQVLTVDRVDAGTIRLPSGRLVVADPGWLEYDTDTVPQADEVPPGEYPVDVFQADTMIVACRVAVTGAPVTSWHLAMREGDSELGLGDGEFYGNPVDTATIALVDRDGTKAYSQSETDKAMADIDKAPSRTISDEGTGTDLVVVSGWTDGTYPVWLGRAEDGEISCFVVDFMSPDLADAKPL